VDFEKCSGRRTNELLQSARTPKTFRLAANRLDTRWAQFLDFRILGVFRITAAPAHFSIFSGDAALGPHDSDPHKARYQVPRPALGDLGRLSTFPSEEGGTYMPWKVVSLILILAIPNLCHIEEVRIEGHATQNQCDLFYQTLRKYKTSAHDRAQHGHMIQRRLQESVRLTTNAEWRYVMSTHLSLKLRLIPCRLPKYTHTPLCHS
jgi:hypothetical protein